MPETQNTSQVNNKRIAKNTILLYFRTLITLLISLYTSRVILQQLGVEDFGIYNVVGGIVCMFAIISSSLSSAISRFITFELGNGDLLKLKKIFSTSINIQIGIAFVILVLGEIVGVWFLNYKMDIPEGRISAANWVLQCSLFAFCINLLSVPYNACVIAHECMSTLAYINIIEAVLKLAVCFLISAAYFDKLIFYAFLMMGVACVICLIYGIYCRRNFEECKYQLVFDKPIIKGMTGFTGWNLITNAAWIFNTQGVNLVTNVYFGVTYNAARGIATQVEGVVSQFVTNFTTAINPQITKTYAANQKEDMFRLMCYGSKYSFFLFYILALPLLLETDFLLSVWLKSVPDNAALFTKLSIIASLVSFITRPFYIGCLATGNIRRYTISVTIVGAFVFPLSWILFALGFSAYWSYIVFIIVYVGVNIMCLLNTKWLLDFPLAMFCRKVLIPVLLVALIGLVVPFLINFIPFSSSIIKAIVMIGISILSTIVTCITVGLSHQERESLYSFVSAFIAKKSKQI